MPVQLAGPVGARRPHSFLAPPLLIYLLWGLVQQPTSMPPNYGDAIGQIVAAPILMLALFWLLADRLGIRSRSLRLLVVVLVIVVVSAAVPLCQNGWQGGSTGEETLACGFATAASALRVPLYHTRLQVFVRAGQPTAPIAKSDVSIGTSRSE